ncbi:MAG: hypothetical protein QM770_20385 [Tepidisphaeraceae bacterium]
MTFRTRLACASIALLTFAAPNARAQADTEHFDTATGLMGQKDYAGAAVEYRKSIEADPRYKEAWQGLADALKAMGKDASAAQKQADAAPAVRSGDAPALTAEQKAVLDAALAPAQPANPLAPAVTPGNPPNQATPPANATETTGEFDDLRFAPLDEKKWKSEVVNNNLVFSTALPAPDFCTVTMYASKDFAGDHDAFVKAFNDAVDADAKAHGVKSFERDSGVQQAAKTETAEAVQRGTYGVTDQFHVRAFYLAIRMGGRMQFVVYQSSGDETFNANMADVQKMLSSLKVVPKEK